MKVLVATEYRIIVYNGDFYVYKKLKDIIERYYNAFGLLTLCSRVIESPINDKMYKISDYVSDVVKIDLASTFFYINYKRLEKTIGRHDLVIGRFDSIISCRAAALSRRLGIPFLAEVMADAWDGYWNHGILGKVLAPYMYLSTRRAIYHSDYAVYVTEHFLQKRYPCKNKSIHASNVSIQPSDLQILDERLEFIDRSYHRINITTTAAVNVVAKGQEYVIRAIPRINKMGFQVQYTLIGGGDCSRLYKLACRLGVESQVVFLGEKSIDEIFQVLKKTHVYIQPSLQEGLPRSVIEAMSCACPVIGARTAGIPELIDSSCVFKRRSSKAIAYSLLDLIKSRSRQKDMAILNFNKSKEYTIDILTNRRERYFSEIINNIIYK